MRRRLIIGSCLLAALTLVSAAEGQPRRGRRAPVERAPAEGASEVEEVDRVVVRWISRATGGVQQPQFITARELAFEARVEAIVENRGRRGPPYLDKHVRSALERRIAETMLAQLPVDPKPSPRQVAIYAESARRLLEKRISEPILRLKADALKAAGRLNAETTAEARNEAEAQAAEILRRARSAEGIAPGELDTIMRRRARASWYLDKTVAPMLRPSELDLREVHQRGETPFTERSFDDAADDLRQWYVASRLATALDRYFRSVRSKVKITMIERPEASVVRRGGRRRRQRTVHIPRPVPRRFARRGR